MGLTIFKTNLSDLNKEFRISSKHRFNSLKLKEVLSKGKFIQLGKLLKSAPQYGSGQAGKLVDDEDFVRYIRITDVDSYGALKYDGIMTVDVVEEKYILKDLDFLFARSGNTVGKSFLFQSEIHPKSIFAGYFIRFDINYSFIRPKLMFWFTKSQIFDLWRNATIRVMGQPNINAEEYKELPIPIIDDNEQLRILAKIEIVENEVLVLQSKILEPLSIINEVFAQEYGYGQTLWKEFGKGMTAGTQKSDSKTAKHYKVGLNQMVNSQILRVSSRFHNPLTQTLTKILRGKGTMQLKDILTEPIKRGVQPKADPEGEVCAIKTGQLKNGYFDFTDCEMLTSDFYDKNPKGQVKINDVLIGCNSHLMYI